MTIPTEFDQVFEEMNAPDYPVTCDQCGAEGTNESMKDHRCLTKEEAELVAGAIPLQALPSDEVCANDCHFGDHDESPASRAGERGRGEQWYGIPDEAGNYDIYENSGSHRIARACSMGYMQRIITDHNQHATMIEQRERLVKTLKMTAHNAADGSGPCWCVVDDRVFGHHQKCMSIRRVLNEVKLAIATIEQETEVESNTSGEVGR